MDQPEPATEAANAAPNTMRPVITSIMPIATVADDDEQTLEDEYPGALPGAFSDLNHWATSAKLTECATAASAPSLQSS